MVGTLVTRFCAIVALVAFSVALLEQILATRRSHLQTRSDGSATISQFIIKAITPSNDCRVIQVIAGDSCGALASRCGISAADFTKYNPATGLCSSLAVGERVCCSSGTLPDITPKPGSDGQCAKYNVVKNDTCSSIAAKNGLKASDLSTFNDKVTWGWAGCDKLIQGLAICLSSGSPPLPATQPNAVCGPTAPNITIRAGTQDISSVNPCPLNACCNIWGQCGITSDFCQPKRGPTGNPGTAPNGSNGCISNCGTSIVNNGHRPAMFKNIAYYESWNMDRPCMSVGISDLDLTNYTHLHWSFGTISPAFQVVVNDTYKQFAEFISVNNTKKIVSIGGWDYSTNPSTYQALRTAMSPANAGTFAKNVAQFVVANNLDGIDFDWEYPGAPDIPGIPPGLKSDGPNYLAFLQMLRSALPQGKSISMAAPASFWYLKQFPVAQMSKSLDYIVYMTYDLHGQWDFGSNYSQDGCISGSCLRSHVNLTETNYALAMITKAGVSADKITVGISSYGRSFAMTTPGCTGPMCTYKGPDSAALPGSCTGTPGILANGEIDQIIVGSALTAITDLASGNLKGANAAGFKSWHDHDSDSDILVYNSNQWVAYMNDTTKAARVQHYQQLNFGGVVDWAIDLQDISAGDDSDDDDEDESIYGPFPTPSKCDQTFKTLDALNAAAGSFPDDCVPYYTVATLSTTFNQAIANYTHMMKTGYDGKFKTYAKAIAGDAKDAVHDFVEANGNKYFTCNIMEETYCCAECSKKAANKDRPCFFCFDGDCYATTDTKKENLLMRWANESEPCPPDMSRRGYGSKNDQSIYWNLLPDQHDQFLADVAANASLSTNNITFATYKRKEGKCKNKAAANDPCWNVGYDFNMPVTNGKIKWTDIVDPKDTVATALSKSSGLVDQVATAAIDLRLRTYSGDAYELVDAISMPILMIVNAVEGMSSIEEVADKIDAAKRKAIILAFLGALLFFLPVVGEVASVAGLADLGVALSSLAVIGDVAMDVYTIVSDPSNAPLAIFSLLLTPIGLGDLGAVSKAAKARRGFDDVKVAKLGAKVEKGLATVKKVCNVCRKR